ncbi:nitroreductase family protein [Paenibacillus radicis (ex Xue et al. 2023)]|uniref:Putative NAD(P)H nitroreductase n=1 Tax=Paenibacillus radicis (ex Xue et al. 2023) TaxID=2972489 RepID=A0ABT1YGT7_9BACL|nr:nitroreductase [Paenibacillus radicis (ex Xue et al. 2023)]MCR8631438.1 nitroreductase [Paenibacillus radicis (ex Xue et al. 2023)]
MNQETINTIGLWEAIRDRRSVGKVKQDPLDRNDIEKLLEAAAWAPSHHTTEPWRFFVMTGPGRQVLGDAYADIAMELDRKKTDDELEILRKKQADKAFRAPVVIAVAVSPSSAAGVNRMEEFAAVHSAVQNLLLAAHGMGFGAVWRTGEPAYHPRMKQAFGLSEAEQIVGLIYIGYPVNPQQPGKREPVAAKTVWITE